MKNKKLKNENYFEIEADDNVVELTKMVSILPSPKLKEMHDTTDCTIKAYENGNPKIVSIVSKEHYEELKLLLKLSEIEFKKRAMVEKEILRNNNEPKMPSKN